MSKSSRRHFLGMVGVGSVSVVGAKAFAAEDPLPHLVQMPTYVCRECGCQQALYRKRGADGNLEFYVDETHADGCSHRGVRS